jgi:hypothetical protein
MRKLLKKHFFAPDAVVTDKLRAYGATKSEIGLSARYEQGLRRNNRAERCLTTEPSRRRDGEWSDGGGDDVEREAVHQGRLAARQAPPDTAARA